MNEQPTISTDLAFDDVTLGFPVPHNGTYPCVITKCELGRSKVKPDGTGNNPMLTVTLKPTVAVKCTSFEPDGTTKEIEIEANSREIFTSYAVIKPRAMQNLKELYLALKKRYNGKTVPEIENEVRNDAPTFVGQHVKVVAERRTLNNPTDGSKRTVSQVAHIVGV